MSSDDSSDEDNIPTDEEDENNSGEESSEGGGLSDGRMSSSDSEDDSRSSSDGDNNSSNIGSNETNSQNQGINPKRKKAGRPGNIPENKHQNLNLPSATYRLAEELIRKFPPNQFINSTNPIPLDQIFGYQPAILLPDQQIPFRQSLKQISIKPIYLDEKKEYFCVKCQREQDNCICRTCKKLGWKFCDSCSGYVDSKSHPHFHHSTGYMYETIDFPVSNCGYYYCAHCRRGYEESKVMCDCVAVWKFCVLEECGVYHTLIHDHSEMNEIKKESMKK